MQRLVPTLAVLALAALAIPAAPHRASADTPPYWLCRDGLTSVRSPSGAAARTVCDQGERARAFLAACGIRGYSPISVRMTRNLGERSEYKAGDYDPQTGRVRLLTLAAYIQSTHARFGIVGMARALHAGVAAHEVAHGIFHEHAAQLDLPETAHEYVAYVTQLAMLPADVQRTVLTRSDMPQITNLFVFSFFLLRADPERFALAAFRHFNQPENGCAFLKQVTDGKVHFPPPSD